MYEIKIENIFEGPMDLLLFLIKKNEVDIYDIPIALITDQFLGYIEWMKAMNIDFAGDFIVMASTLTHIKSKLLLPVHESENGKSEDDPRMEVVRPLVEYLNMKSAAEELSKRDLSGEDIFVRNPPRSEFFINREDEVIQADLSELIDAFQKILENIPAEHKIDFSDEKISIKDKIAELIDIFEKSGDMTFHELFQTNRKKSEKIVTFLAILEMAKLSLIQITQNVQTGVIKVSYL